MLIYKVLQNQNIFDLSLQVYGDIESVVQLIKDNPEIDINKEIPFGFPLKYIDKVNDFKTFVNRKKIDVSTNDGATQTGKAFDSSFDKKEFN